LLSGKACRRDDGDCRCAACEKAVDRQVARGINGGSREPSLLRGIELRRLLVVSGRIRDRRSAGRGGLLGILRRRVSSLLGATCELAQTVGVDAIAGRGARARTADHSQEDAFVFDQRRLVNLGAREARESRPLGLDDRLDGVAVCGDDRLLGELERPGHAGATPTWTFLNRAGAAPWLTCACCPG
jgi:hypothetical protein